MKTRAWRFGALITVAAMAAMFAGPTVATASSGGAIAFSGAIVAPQLEISAAPVVGVGLAGAQVRHGASAVTLTFNAPPGVATGADVALQVNGGAAARDGAIAARFVDRAGRVFAAARDGHYRVGREGGVLALSARKGNGVGAETRVIVVVSYD